MTPARRWRLRIASGPGTAADGTASGWWLRLLVMRPEPRMVYYIAIGGDAQVPVRPWPQLFRERRGAGGRQVLSGIACCGIFLGRQRLAHQTPAEAATATLAEDVLSAAAALDIDHESEVPRGGEDHDGPAASEGEPQHDSGGPL